MNISVTLALILIVAMSAAWSTSCTVALYVSPLVSLTRTPRLLATTWAFVTMRPSALIMKPEPLEMGISRPENGCLLRHYVQNGLVYKSLQLSIQSPVSYPTSAPHPATGVVLVPRPDKNEGCVKCKTCDKNLTVRIR